MQHILTGILANNNKGKQPRKTNNNKKTKSNKPQKTRNQLSITVRAAPTAKTERVTSRGLTQTRKLANGHTEFRSATTIPITSTSNGTSAVVSTDLTVGTASAFPAASNLAKSFDKVKWKALNIRWVPTLPTTSGGSVAMYYDTDRTDTGATTMTQAASNKGAVMGAIWDRLGYRCNKQMLRSNEWFTTYRSSSSTTTENTFASPGRVHVFYTGQPGVTYTTSTVIGYLLLQYTLEFGFPSADSDSTVPTRVSPGRQLRETNVVTYDERTVRVYENFVAGCEDPPGSIYEFLRYFDSESRPILERMKKFKPDAEALRLRPHSLNRGGLITPALIGEVTPLVSAGSETDLSSYWSTEESHDCYDH